MCEPEWLQLECPHIQWARRRQITSGMLMRWTKLIYWFKHLCWWCTCCWWGRGSLWKGLWNAPGELCVLLLEESSAKLSWRIWSFMGNRGLVMAQRSFCNCSLWSLPLKGLCIFLWLDVLVGLGSLWLKDFCLFFRLFSGEQSQSLSFL